MEPHSQTKQNKIVLCLETRSGFLLTTATQFLTEHIYNYKNQRRVLKYTEFTLWFTETSDWIPGSRLQITGPRAALTTWPLDQLEADVVVFPMIAWSGVFCLNPDGF